MKKNYKDISKRIKSISQEVGELKVILYGKSGTGKTTLAASFPKPILIDVREKGQKSVKTVKGLKMLAVKEWQDLLDIYWFLKNEDHDFETAIIDTVGNAQTLAIEWVMDKNNKKGKAGDWGTMTQKMWGEVSTMVKELTLNFRDLDMNIVYIAHHRVFQQNEEDADTIAIDPYVGPAVTPSVAAVLNAAVDIIGETFIGEKTITTRDKKTGKKEEERNVNYYLRVGPHSSYITKFRNSKETETPDVIKNPDYKSLINLME